jgi:hypothetical protein
VLLRAGVGRSSTGRLYGAARKSRSGKSVGVVDETALNLMPVPVLDGGHILIMALEGIARRDFSMQVKEKMLLAGFVVLMMLMVTVIYNDLTRISWLERLMPWRN